MAKQVNVIDVEEEVVEILAESLISMSDGIKKLLSGPLRRKTIVLLIQHSCGANGRPTQRTINEVLWAIENLGENWVEDQ